MEQEGTHPPRAQLTAFPKFGFKSPYDPAKALRYEWAPLILLTGVLLSSSVDFVSDLR
jgi:hypothetical protein